MNIVIPRGWEPTTIREVFCTMGGGTPSTRVPEFWDGTIPWITSADLQEDGTIVPRKRITESAIIASTTNLVPAGSVVVATRVGLGKVALAKEPLCFSQDCTALLINGDGIHPQFVRLQMQRTACTFRGRGTTISGITKKQLLDTPFLVAPTPEQHRIVEAIESYFTRLDDAVATLERVQRNLKRYRASVLKSAVEGRLVPTEAELARAEGRDYEPASVLLERILAERRRQWGALANRGRYVEPIAPNHAGLPELPEGWCWATLSQLGELNRGKSRHRPRNDPRLLGGPYPFIQTGDVKKADGFISSYEDTYSEFGLAQSRLWPAGTVCITIAANIAETGLLMLEACFPDSIVGFLTTNVHLARYVELFLRTARQRLDQYAPGTAQKNINLEVLSEVAVPLPPRNEQARIIAEIDRQFSVAAHCASVAADSVNRCASLRQAVLKWAFEGRLANQHPNDEPASVLLARIRDEHEAAQANAKRTARRLGRRRATA